MSKKIKIFKLADFRWLTLSNAIVVIGGMMGYGLIATTWLNMDEEQAISMLAILPFMAIIVGISTTITLRSVRKRMHYLLDGINRLTDGDLTVVLEEKNAGEYAPIYKGFNLMTSELRKTKNEMQHFVNELSHEFKTPITSVSGFAQYLIETGEDIESPKRMQYLQIIADESLRLASLSQKTLLLSKVEASEIITEKEEFSLSEQIKSCAILLLPKIEQKNITLELDVNNIKYLGNAELMEQVWINLLGNAIKFTPENGEIKISAYYQNNAIAISFIDSGIGMSDETCRHIFEKYYQYDTGSAVQGNGIGLSIVYRIVSLCNGSITVDSILNEGSTFKVTLPVKKGFPH
jgi:signal transduction histidine kinase